MAEYYKTPKYHAKISYIDPVDNMRHFLSHDGVQDVDVSHERVLTMNGVQDGKRFIHIINSDGWDDIFMEEIKDG